MDHDSNGKAKRGQDATQRQHATRNFVNWQAPKLARTFGPHECAMMTERADACFSGPRLRLYIYLFKFCGSFRFFAHESENPHLLSTLTVYIHTQHAFSPSVLIKCSICSYHPLMRTVRMNGSRKRFTAYDTQSYYTLTGLCWREQLELGCRYSYRPFSWREPSGIR